MIYLMKHNRKIYIVLTCAIIFSFIFFGTGRTHVDEKQDTVAFVTASKTKVMESELAGLLRLLDMTEVEGKNSWQQTQYLTQDFLAREIFETGLAELIFRENSAAIAAELNPKLAQEAGYAPYQHPQLPSWGAAAIWKQYAPVLNTAYEDYKASLNKTVDAEVFSKRVALFCAQRRFQPSILKRVLFNQQQQLGGYFVDKALPSKDLSLFGYHNIEQWFGKTFTRKLGEFVCNLSDLALEKGFDVSAQEARADLLANCEGSLKGTDGRMNAEQFFAGVLAQNGLTEHGACDSWQRALLLKRLFADFSGRVFLDPAPYAELANYSQAKRETVTLNLPLAASVTNNEQLWLLETYLNAAFAPRKNPADLPESARKVDEVAKTAPYLILSDYKVEVAKYSTKPLQAALLLSEVQDWLLSDAGWQALKTLPELRGALDGAAANDDLGRMKALAQLSDEQRSAYNAFARRTLAAAKKERIQEALAGASKKEQVLAFSAQQARVSLEGINDAAALQNLLDKGDADLSCYSQDNGTFYAIKLVSKAEKRVGTFAEVATSQGLKDALKANLDKHWKSIREEKRAVFFNADTNDWFAFDAKRNEVAESFFAPLCEAIAKTANKDPLVPQSPKDTPNFYALHRFDSVFTASVKALNSGKTEDELLSLADSGLVQQLRFVKSSKQIERGASREAVAVFAADLQQWTQAGLQLFKPLTESSETLKPAELSFAAQSLRAKATCVQVDALLAEVNKRAGKS